jgi:hypothetical protein
MFMYILNCNHATYDKQYFLICDKNFEAKELDCVTSV